MNLEIRLATESDFEQVGNIFAEENRYHAELMPEVFQVADPIMTSEWYSGVLKDSRTALFVAELEAEVVGVALVELKTNLDDPIFRQRRYVYIDEIAVAASHRGQGIGRLLMERIRQWGQEQGITEIELQVWERNGHAISFYKKLGYQMWRRTMRYTIDDQKQKSGRRRS
jgi:ribosomal protein S18 acetylase RimI-like enzyme